ncbi:MAG: hypothetical protein V1922_01110 [bacterium]
MGRAEHSIGRSPLGTGNSDRWEKKHAVGLAKGKKFVVQEIAFSAILQHPSFFSVGRYHFISSQEYSSFHEAVELKIFQD